MYKYTFETMFNIIYNQKRENENGILSIHHFGKNEKIKRVIPFNSGNFRQDSGKMAPPYCIDNRRNCYSIFRDYFESGY